MPRAITTTTIPASAILAIVNPMVANGRKIDAEEREDPRCEYGVEGVGSDPDHEHENPPDHREA